VNVRLATLDDLPAIRAHLEALAAEPDRHVPLEPDEVDAVAADLRPLIGKGAVVVACDPDVIGFVSMRRGTRKWLAHAAYLGISIRKAYRGRGVGRALMTAAVDWARDHGVARIELHVMARNTTAIALYEKLGFQREGVNRGALCIDGVLHDDLVMARVT
jgi:RimJ/RimL family protein N-acetyltransferase